MTDDQFSDREIYARWTKAVLEQALCQPVISAEVWGPGHDPEPLARFAYYLDRTRPIVLLISPQPFIEFTAPRLIMEARPGVISGIKIAGIAAGGDELDLPSFGHDDLLVLSCRDGLTIPNQSRLLHDLSITDNPVLIGCSHPERVPKPLLSKVDLTIDLGCPGPAAFRQAFTELFGEEPGQNDGDEDWIKFILPTDLQRACRLNYNAERALEYIRRRVEARTWPLRPESQPDLQDLSGLGEAKSIAEDMISEIVLAGRGEMDWRNVDRGMLLVGPPGTGKTTLARAIAREAGVKFVAASATSWQAADHLGGHLREIRKSFDQAREFQPAILFIDEIDSIGNREDFDPAVASYQTSVVNCLLEEMDGFRGEDEIIVIGATNYEEAVDPALRRSGRLDQIARVGYPTVEALGDIYRFYLKKCREQGYVVSDLNVDELAGLSFGLTGADIEFILKGATRRARRQDAELRQEHLVAEILRKPRYDLPHNRPIDHLTMHRLARHEAGHAVMQLLGDDRGEKIGYVSIAPRSDGRIGVVANIAARMPAVTLRAFKQRIRILLAGRAAEEVCYGTDYVSDIAGNYGDESDLAQATRLAGDLLGRTGLANDGDLLWDNPELTGATDRLDQRIDKLLAALYQETVGQLQENRTLLDNVAGSLIEHQELTGDQIRQQLLAHQDG